MKTQEKNHQAGFTLIEYIVALVIAAIVGAMVYTYMGSMLTKSSEPIFRLQKASNLHQVMENIVADYNRLNALNLRYNWQASIPYAIGSIVVPKISNGHYYKCIVAGTSGSGPTWTPPTSGTIPPDGGVTWMEGGVIWQLSGTPNENIVWHTSQAYSVNDIMIPIKNNGHYYRCTTGGTSSSTIPVAWRPSRNYDVNTIVVPSLFNGHYYKSTAGTSGTTEPAWPTTNGGTVNNGTVTWTEVPDGTIRWTEAGTILAKSTTTASNNDNVLNDNILNYLTTTPGRYGSGYTLVTTGSNKTRFIKFSGTSPNLSEDPNDISTTDEKNILKVTIQDSTTGETLSELFTIR